ncbi:response regulator [Paenibacillus validus]|uniref:Transcriptional regulatory protein n=2 Tax=Bacteria TaxID=2 RepID=A0A7X2ZER7_9BACL|nr:MULTISPECIES: response regulator [Paenibacillus]MED4601521.1 response regulator [Paenibacillus validus]MED4607903.1 response regulator [Paenibacillus validus]MUG73589.1 response regulator [Paenibacillus validus]
MSNTEKPHFRVLLIEDDPMVQEVNRQFVEQVDGFQVVGTAANGLEGLKLIEQLKPDLVFLDIFMPSLDGIATLQRLRSSMLPVDVIVVTAAKDTETVRTMMRNGAFDYIIKPFKMERVRQTLERYRAQQMALRPGESVTQDQLDDLLISGETANEAGTKEAPVDDVQVPSDDLPKGLNAATLKQVLSVMKLQGGRLSAEETAAGVGISRVTARRYLEFLEKRGIVRLEVHYGGLGRPVNRYELQRDPNNPK